MARRTPMPLAIAATLLIGTLGGGLNSLMIARPGLPPLIVTLGTFSLFRGVAEGLTRGIDNYSGFSRRFCFLGKATLSVSYRRSSLFSRLPSPAGRGNCTAPRLAGVSMRLIFSRGRALRRITGSAATSNYLSAVGVFGEPRGCNHASRISDRQNRMREPVMS